MQRKNLKYRNMLSMSKNGKICKYVQNKILFFIFDYNSNCKKQTNVNKSGPYCPYL